MLECQLHASNKIKPAPLLILGCRDESTMRQHSAPRSGPKCSQDARLICEGAFLRNPGAAPPAPGQLFVGWFTTQLKKYMAGHRNAMLLCAAMCCYVLLCVAMCCYVLLRAAMCCYVLLCAAMCCCAKCCCAKCCCVLLCAAMCCYVLLRAAMCCYVKCPLMLP